MVAGGIVHMGKKEALQQDSSQSLFKKTTSSIRKAKEIMQKFL